MGTLWEILWNLLKDLVVAILTLNWGFVASLGTIFFNWWDAIWARIARQIEQVGESWAYTIQTIWNTISSIWYWLDRRVTEAKAYALQQVQAVIDWLQAELANLGIFLDSIIDTVTALLQDLLASWLDAAWEFISPYVDAVKAWVTDTFGWLLASYTLFTVWLESVRDAVTWLATYAWTSLTSFLADPWGFVLGLLGGSIINMLNWWLEWVNPLSDFMTQDLPGLRNLVARGLDFLLEFMDRPADTILLLLEDIFLGWLERLIADNW